MKIFSNRFINFTSIIITIIIVLFINIYINKINSKNYKNIFLEETISDENIIQKPNKEKSSENNLEEDYNWYIKISSIDLYAPIEETTKMEVLNKAVGHFEDTSFKIGNVGLAAHNRGYEKNYFEKLKEVKKGDEVVYKYEEFNKTYIVDIIEIIRNTDWSYLENTESNRITMITCVEGNPELRLCVQATEKE